MKKVSLLIIGLITSLSMFGSSFPVSPKKIKTYNSVEEILRIIDPNVLPHGPVADEFGGSTAYIEVLNQKATEIRNYIAAKYYEDLSSLSNLEVVMLGVVMVPFESRDMMPGYMSYEQMFRCMMNAIGAVSGIGLMVNNFVTLWNSGASAATLLSTVKSIFKISAGWFAVGWAVYEFGDCVGWW
ncbi:MAG TPA: hypothetical protein PKJ94_02650 [Ferruginibacter sp.]|nr:hypothetical protein [Ferruginibacter sp.]